MTEQKTIQDMIWSSINAIRATDGKDAVLLAREVVNLSCLYANLTDKIADFEQAYNVKMAWIQAQDIEKPFNKVEIESKITAEYYQLKKALALERAVIQTIRSSNRLIDLKEKEMQLAKYQ